MPGGSLGLSLPIYEMEGVEVNKYLTRAPRGAARSGSGSDSLHEPRSPTRVPCPTPRLRSRALWPGPACVSPSSALPAFFCSCPRSGFPSSLQIQAALPLRGTPGELADEVSS